MLLTTDEIMLFLMRNKVSKQNIYALICKLNTFTDMKIFTRTAAIHAYLSSEKNAGKTVGFVPTMGALHQGHISLIRASRKENDITVCSLFVNPSQFNDAEDLQKYPRNHDVDLAMLTEENCEVAFLPTVLEVYPPGLETAVNVDLEGLDRRLEGKFRPGHFDGMMEVVHRLLQITIPDKLYMGQKDFQQQLIVDKMIEKLGLSVSLEVCPIIREADGLAMSSRNTRLTQEFRSRAAVINQALTAIAENFDKMDLSACRQEALTTIRHAGLRPEYLEICETESLEALETWKSKGQHVALTAAWAGDIRLIDNVVF